MPTFHWRGHHKQGEPFCLAFKSFYVLKCDLTTSSYCLENEKSIEMGSNDAYSLMRFGEFQQKDNFEHKN